MNVIRPCEDGQGHKYAFSVKISEKLFPLSIIFLAISGTWSNLLYLISKMNPILSLNLLKVFEDCLSNIIATAMSSEFMGCAYLQGSTTDAYRFSVWFISIVAQPEVLFGLDEI